jgi:predicted permease
MDPKTVDIFNRVLPILLLLFLGYLIRQTRFLSGELIEGLRKVVVYLALPAVLFLSFLQVELKPSFLVVFFVIFFLCVVLYGLGRLMRPRLAPNQTYFPFLTTGFEYGMLGISLFASAYGLQNIGYIAVIDLGHEIFIWFVFLALLMMTRESARRPGQLFQSFLKSPVILGILAGILLNLAGVGQSLAEWPVAGGIMSALEFLASMTVPLILIIVGYGIQLNREGFGSASRVVLFRLVILIPLALLLGRVLIQDLLQLEKAFAVALFVLLILPPPFIVPLFMSQDSISDRQYVNNVLTLHTIVTITVFAIFFILNPSI